MGLGGVGSLENISPCNFLLYSGDNDRTGGSALPGSRLGAGILSDRSFIGLKDSVSEATLKVKKNIVDQ